MINLFKKKPITYVKESTMEEVYQQEHYYRLTIVDKAGAMKKVEDQDALMERLFEAMKNHRLKIVLRDVFGLSYEYLLEVSGFGCDRIVDVVITKKSRFDYSLFWSCF